MKPGPPAAGVDLDGPPLRTATLAPAGQDRRARARRDSLIRPAAAIVPERSVAGRSLLAVVAIMTFLAAVTAGGVQLVASAAADWGSQVSQEVTVQVRPQEGRDLSADVDRALTTVRGMPGITEARAYTDQETARMLEPWLGTGLDLADLPVPRLIVGRVGGTPDFGRLRALLADRVPSASLDDHRFWVARLAEMARTMVAGGLGVLALMIVATGLSVVFATRGAMAGNRDVVSVLHFVGAHDGFIAAEFQRHFLWLGLKGGLIGGALAGAAFMTVHLLSGRWVATAGGDQLQALFGSFTVGLPGYLAIAATVLLVALTTGLTSRLTVHRVLRDHR